MTKRDEQEIKNKIIIGPAEKMTIIGSEKEVEYEGRVDTGATSSSIDAKIVAELKLGPVLSVKTVRNAHGETLRPVVEAEIILKTKKMTTKFTIADRSRMKYKVLIGNQQLTRV